jgi:hypothetical protein
MKVSKRMKRKALKHDWRKAREAYERARDAKELGSHGGASAVRLIDPATGQQTGALPKRKQHRGLVGVERRRIGRVPSRNG